MTFTPAGDRCQILHIGVNQMCSMNFNSLRRDCKAADFRGKFGPQGWSTEWVRALNSPLIGTNAAQQNSTEVKNQSQYCLICHLKTQLALMWLLTSMKNRGKIRRHSKLYSFQPVAQRPPWKWLQVPQSVQCHPLAWLDLLCEDYSSWVLISWIPRGLLWHSCYQRESFFRPLPALYSPHLLQGKIIYPSGYFLLGGDTQPKSAANSRHKTLQNLKSRNSPIKSTFVITGWDLSLLRGLLLQNGAVPRLSLKLFNEAWLVKR